jgi:hypothetical protein
MPQYHNLTGTAQPSVLPFLPRSLCVLSGEWRDVTFLCASLSQWALLAVLMTGRGIPTHAKTSWVYGDE